jgi:transcriptional regulator with XRE-family HTH domain
MQTAPAPDGTSASVRIALNRHRQRELYGCPLGDRVRRLTGALGITQARLARTLGVSPPMLSQLASGRRVKIGDPAVLARLQLLDQRCAAAPPHDRAAVEALLEEVGRARLQWAARDQATRRPARPAAATAAPAGEALRAVAPPARLAAAAATLAPGFPELAAVLRQAAAHPGGPGAGAAPGAARGPRRPPRRPW